MRFNLNKTHKIVISALVVAVLLVFGFVSWAGSRAAEYVKQQVAAQNFVKGKLQVADIGAELSGDVWISNITWHDPEGKLVARIPRLNISIRLSDIFGAGLGANSIELITLERPELYLVYDAKSGLNVSNLMVMGPEKADKENEGEDKNPFRGIFSIEKGFLQIESGKNKLVYESFDSKLQYQDFPKVTGMVQAKQNNADFAGNIELTYTQKGEVLKLDVEGRSILLTDFFAMIPVQSNFSVSDGNISTINASLELAPDQPLKISTHGSFSNLAAQSMGVKATDFKGSFAGNQDEVTFSEFDGKVNEQPVQLSGKIILKDSPYKLDMKVQSAAFKPSALSSGIAIDDIFAFNAAITGVSDAPQMKGTFSAASVHTDQLALVNVGGKFDYDKGVIKLDNVAAGVYGGSVAGGGTVKVDDQSFNFNVKGSGISAKAMTSTNLNGALSFNANATGTGSPDSAAVNGNFAIGKGDFNGLPFNSMTGNFVKRGSVTEFSNVVINTLAGSISVGATVQSDGKVKFDDIDVSKINEENVKESLQEKAKEELERGKDKLSNALKKIF